MHINKLSKGIGEIQIDDLQYIWKSPKIYNEVLANNIWLIYGRKGSGKSTLIDYLRNDIKDAKIIIVRPSEQDLFTKVLASISAYSESASDRELEVSVVNTIAFILISRIMQEICSASDTDGRSEDYIIVNKFLVQNDFIRGSAIGRAIRILTNTVGTLELIPNLDKVLRGHLKRIPLTFSNST